MTKLYALIDLTL